MPQAHTTPVRILNPTGPMPRGLKDFRRIMQEKRCFVDKTLFIADMFNNADLVALITRPRRFGKTTNLTMLQAFLQNSRADESHQQANRALFDGTQISENAAVMKHQGQYPVIVLTLKDVKESTWPEAFAQLCNIISQEIDRHAVSREFEIPGFGHQERRQWNRILHFDDATLTDWKNALALLCKLLTLHYKQAPWLLLDEYDSPILSLIHI